MTAANATHSTPPERARVRCAACGHVVFDGNAIKSRVVVVSETGAQAKCRCKRWVSVPIVYRD